jgi:beta-mannosidase
MELSLQGASGKVVKETSLVGITQKDKTTISGHTVIDEPVNLQWPKRYGALNLYYAMVTLVSSTWKESTKVTKRVGFPTTFLSLSLVTDEQLAARVAHGANWHFQINGHTLYVSDSRRC